MSTTHYTSCIHHPQIVQWLMITALRNVWQQVMSYFQIVFQHCLEGQKKNHKTTLGQDCLSKPRFEPGWFNSTHKCHPFDCDIQWTSKQFTCKSVWYITQSWPSLLQLYFPNHFIWTIHAQTLNYVHQVHSSEQCYCTIQCSMHIKHSWLHKSASNH